MTDIKHVAFDVHQATIKICMMRCEPTPTKRRAMRATATNPKARSVLPGYQKITSAGR